MREKIILKTISPVHIGGKTQELGLLENVVLGGCCYVVSEGSLGRALLEKNKLDALSLEIGRQGRRFNLDNFLRSLHLLNKNFLSKTADYCCDTILSNTPLRMRPFVRDAFSRPYIPGSSIKGVIRTAVLYGLLKKMQAEDADCFQRCFLNIVEQKLREFNNAEEWVRSKGWFKDKIKRNMAGRIEMLLLQHFDLPTRDGPVRRGPTGQQKDFMRVLKVSDTAPLDKNDLTLVEVQVISLTGENDVYLKTPIYVEIIPPGREMEFSITLDESIWADFSSRSGDRLPFKTLEEVFALVNDFAADIWQFEKAFSDNIAGHKSVEMKDFYRHTSASMRVGWGSGLSGASLLMLLPQDLRRAVRDNLFEPRDRFAFPKSRRAVMDGDLPRWPLGWVNMETI
jgi:CRISPR-associated protein Csm5